MNLNELQSLLQKSILTQQPLIQSELQPPPKGCIDDRIAIYSSGFYQRLKESLSMDFPCLSKLMGEKKFSKMSEKYIEQYPSLSPTLNFYGKLMPHFLMETEPYKNKPFLAEIATFEWAEYMAMVSKDNRLQRVSDLQAVAPEKWPDLRFYLHPSCQLLSFHWNSLSLIKSIRDNRLNLQAKKLTPPQQVLVWRQQTDVNYCILDDLQFNFLHQITQGASFLELCDHLSLHMPEEEATAYIVKQMHIWLAEQLFVYPG
jgi:hypothetical protein